MNPIPREEATEILEALPLRMPIEDAHERLKTWLSWACRLAHLPKDPCPTLPQRKARLRSLKEHALELARLQSEDPLLPLYVPPSKGLSIEELRRMFETLGQGCRMFADLLDPEWERLGTTSVDIHLKGRAKPLDLGRRNALWCLLDAFEDLTGEEATVTLGGSPCLEFVDRVAPFIGVDEMTETGRSRERTLYKQKERRSRPTAKMQDDGLYRALARAKRDRSRSAEHQVDWGRIVARFEACLP